MYTISASTCGAKLDASSGYNGICDGTVLVGSLFRVTPAEYQNADNQRKNRSHAAQPQDSQNCGAVPCGRRVIFKTIQKQLVDRATDFPGRCIHQTQSHVARRILDPVKVP